MSASNTRRRRFSALRKAQRAVNSSQSRRQKRRTRVRRSEVGPAIKAVYRTSRLLRTDMGVRYGERVAERSVNRETWARLVAELINTEAGGNTTKFAQLVGVTYKTVRRWILQQTDVSEESIRQVANALHVRPGPLLVQVGLYQPGELAEPVEPTPDAADDPALQAILDADVPPRVKARMVQRLQQLRQADQQRHVDEVQWWIDQARGA